MPSIGYRFGSVPRAGEPGALHFDNINVREFIHRWNNEYEDFGLSEPQRRARLSNYCSLEIKDTIELLFSYKEKIG